MKKMTIYVIVDSVSQNLLRVFQAISLEEAKRSFAMFVNQTCKDLPDKSSVRLINMNSSDFTFEMPECYVDISSGVEVCNGFVISDESSES